MIKLPRLNALNWRTQPQLFERYWDQTMTQIETTFNQILDIPVIKAALEALNNTLTSSGGSDYVGSDDGAGGSMWSSVQTFINYIKSTAGAGIVGADDGAGGSMWTTVQGYINYLKSSAGATAISFLSALSGAVPRTMTSKSSDIVSVKDFGAVGNGTTDDTSAVNLAITAAISASADLFWPAGTYLTTGNLNNFYSVRHVGEGVIKRGSNLFYVEPERTQTNSVYIDTTGSDSNDGLSTSQARRTIQATVNALLNARSMYSSYVINVAAGTYNENVTIPDYQAQADGYFEIKGPATATVIDTPTVIVDGTSLSGDAMILGAGNKVKLSNILFTNLTGGRNCVRVATGTVAWLYNCQSVDGTARSLCQTLRGGTTFVTGGGKVGGNIGFDCLSSSNLTLGYTATSTADGTFIKNTTQAGIYLLAQAYCSSSYGDYTDNSVVVYAYHNARYETKGDDYKRNARVYKLLGSHYLESLVTPPVYNHGTADSNTILNELDQFSSEEVFHSGGRGGLDVLHSRSTGTTTGPATSALARNFKTFPAYSLTSSGKYVEVECAVRGTGTGSKTLELKFGTAVLSTFTMPPGTVYGKFRVLVWANGTTQLIVNNDLSGSLGHTTVMRTGTTIDSTISNTLALYMTVPTTGDTAVVYDARCVLWG